MSDEFGAVRNVGGLMQALNGAAIPLGPVENWPPSLRTTVTFCLNVSFPLVIGWGPESILLYNDAATALFGNVQHPPILGEGGQVGWSEVWDVLGPRFTAVRTTGTATQVVGHLLRARTEEQEVYACTFALSPIWDETGRVGGVLCAITETTHGGHAASQHIWSLAPTERASPNEQLLRHTAAQLQSQLAQILAGIKDDFVMYDDDWRYVYVNDSAAQSLGYPKEQLIGQRIWDLFPDAVGNAFYQHMMEAKASGRETVFEHYYAPWGKWIENRAYPLPDGMLLFNTDITERKRVEAALRDSEARFRHMADHAPVMVWVTEPDGACSYLSISWYHFTGQTPEQSLGFGWLTALHPDDRMATQQTFNSANVRQEAFTLEYQLRRADGVYRWMLDAAVPRFSDMGAFLGYIGSVIDITERKQVELERSRLYAAEQAARITAERVARERDELLAYIAHDLKNPLTPLLATAQLLQRRLQTAATIDVARLQRGLRTIELSAARLAAQLNELQDVAHLHAGRPLDLQWRTLDLVALIERVMTSHQAATEQHQIRMVTALTTLDCRGDPFRIERVITNVLANAIKYSPHGGAITVTLRQETNATMGWAIITVQDSGIGIAPTDLPHVFERFYRGQNVVGQSGTGLGLASTQAIVVQHGGQVDIRSDLGAGTTVTIRLPLTPPTALLSTSAADTDSEEEA